MDQKEADKKRGGPLDFATLRALNKGTARIDVACPLCGPSRRSPVNQRRAVLRIWDDGDFIGYFCGRCETSGWAGLRGLSGAQRVVRGVAPTLGAMEDRAAVAASLWARAMPFGGSPAQAYLEARGCRGLDCARLRYLPARGGHHHAMIARFGSGDVCAVHITRLAADGLGKAGTEKDKIVIGRTRDPIVLFDNPDRPELIVTEGIEDGVSFALATGWSVWAAGSAGRIPAAIRAASGYSPLCVAFDDDNPIPVYGDDGHVVHWRQGAGAQARDRSEKIRPDLVPIEIGRLFQRKMDANKLLQAYGRGILVACVGWSITQAEFRQGRIGFEQMRREIGASEGVMRAILPEPI